MSKTTKMYHGTSMEKAKEILKYGFSDEKDTIWNVSDPEMVYLAEEQNPEECDDDFDSYITLLLKQDRLLQHGLIQKIQIQLYLNLKYLKKSLVFSKMMTAARIHMAAVRLMHLNLMTLLAKVR